MRYQTKLLKDILTKNFPCAKFNVLFIQAKQYCDTSDRILVKTQDLQYANVSNVLLKYTKDIKIVPKGVCAAVSGITHPQIYDIETQCFVDADLLEFIEIDIQNTSSG